MSPVCDNKTIADDSLSVQKFIYRTFSSQLILFPAVENARPRDSIFCTPSFLTTTWCFKNSESSLIFSCLFYSVSAHFQNTDGATRNSVKNVLESFGQCHFFNEKNNLLTYNHIFLWLCLYQKFSG